MTAAYSIPTRLRKFNENLHTAAFPTTRANLTNITPNQYKSGRAYATAALITRRVRVPLKLKLILQPAELERFSRLDRNN